MSYIYEIGDNLKALNETDDRITGESLNTNHRHGIVALGAAGRLQYWDTEEIYKWIQKNPCNPQTRRDLDKYEIAYVEYYKRCLDWEKANSALSRMAICTLLTKLWSNEEKMMLRAMVHPHDFAQHFEMYEKRDTDPEDYERNQAYEALSKGKAGMWLLRHSSLNRPKDEKDQEILNRMRVKMYVLSYNCKVNMCIKHLLIVHRPGHGWCHAVNVIYENGDVRPVMSDDVDYSPCFLDILLLLVGKAKLRLNLEDVCADYMMVKEVKEV